MATITKPVAKLDGSLLLARKGEAMPAVAANQHNNPGLAWGAPAHPHDFQAQDLRAQESRNRDCREHAPSEKAHTQHDTKPIMAHINAHGPNGSARLRPDSFFTAHGRGAQPAPQRGRQTRVSMDQDAVALTLRVEDETYLRLKYLAQATGRSTQQVLSDALDRHLTDNGVPRSQRLVVKPQ